MENISKVITPEEYWEVLPKVQYQMDEPLADPAAVALYFVCQIASEHVKVVLSGEGADELFGGYTIYQVPAHTASFRKLPRWFRNAINRVASLLPPVHGINFFVRGGDVERWFIGNANMFSVKDRKKLLKIKTDAPNPRELTRHYYDKVKDKDDVTKMQYLDIHMWMAGDILLKADKMSMANSVELRVPLLDVEVWKLSKKLPTKYMVRNGQTKEIFRSKAKEKLPEEWSKRRKLGFPVPFGKWVKEEKYYNTIKEIFNSDYAKEFFDVDYINTLLDEHHKGNAANGKKIYVIFVFLTWYKRFFIDEVNS